LPAAGRTRLHRGHHEVTVAGYPGEAAPDGDQHLVADAVTVGVVDRFEAVEVDEQH